MDSLPAVVVALLQSHFGIGDIKKASAKAVQLANMVKEILEDAEDGVVEVTVNEELVLEEEEVDPEYLLPDAEEPKTPGKEFYWFGNRQLDKKTVRQAIDYYRSSDKGSRSLSAMSNRYRWICSRDHLGRLREIEEEETARQEKINGIKERLKVWVEEQMEVGVALHDWDLRHQALKINRDHFHLSGFQASHMFLHRFKKMNKIVSRKITKFVARKTFTDNKKLEEVTEKFIDEVKEIMVQENIPPSAVFNGDQSGFVKEQHNLRSLAPLGSKTVFRVVDSVSATTHSATVLPQVSASGALRSKVCVVLQESGGKLPVKGHFQPDNLVVYAHTSHIMTKALMVKWLQDCVFTNDLPPVTLLILDSWPAFRDHQEILKHVPVGKKVIIKNIPPGCTSKIQPLDVFFFIHVKKIYEEDLVPCAAAASGLSGA